MVIVVVISGLLMLLGGRGTLERKAGMYGAAAGLLYGLSASLCKPTVETFHDDGLAQVLASWEFYAFALAGIAAFLIQQVSLGTGRLAPSVATTSVMNPIVSVLIGIVLLDEVLDEPGWHKAIAWIGLGCALAGAVMISMAREGELRRSSGRAPAGSGGSNGLAGPRATVRPCARSTHDSSGAPGQRASFSRRTSPSGSAWPCSCSARRR